MDYTPPEPCEGDDCDSTDSEKTGDNDDFESNNNSGASMTVGSLIASLMGMLCVVMS